MKKIGVFIVLAILVFTACKKDKTTQTELILGDFSLSKEKLMAGDAVDIAYNGDSEEVEGLYYYMVNSRAFPADINLSEDNKATITIPDSAQAVAFNFKIDDKYDDNNKNGYLIPLHNNEGDIIAGSKASLALYAMYFGEQYGIKKEKDSILKDIKEDLTNHPELKDKWNTTYLNLLYRNDKVEGEKQIKDYLATLSAKSDLTEDEYSDLINLNRTLNNTALSDSISEIAINKFPNGKIVKNSYGKKFFDAKDLDSKEEVFNEYLNKYNDLEGVGGYMAQTLARQYHANGNTDKFDEYANKITNKQSKAGLYNNIAWPLAEKGENLDFAAKISKKSVDLMQSLKDNPTDKPDYMSENQFKNNINGTYNMVADTYALILFKQGKVKEAISYQERIYDKGQTAEVNERYIDYLMADEQYDVAMEKAENFIKKGQGTSKIKENYKLAFSKNNLDGGDANTALAKLEKIGREKKIAEVKKEMLDEPSSDFTLKDTEGKDVTLSSLKGKTVIIDFWATWCGPCKASFPGMQQVVEKYKDDKNVKLLFIDTFERGDNREKLVTDFIKDNKYDFHVLYDNMIEDSNNFEVAKKYGVTGIPMKVIIGPDGNIKFKSVGFSGSNDKLVSELDIMIEILKS
ncbi:TlpA disulfide reductase family protein [Aureibaculum sp. 2210JD6-5]|uniref:TlpA disulfide reductase family protein n=1 Tax=Aureibaculum sp. 2210JD6-5 TaxID=3103957 RepID=UPI002AAE3616|nr:TlpA disulfide reductase family protein [Aureibaculum sp. 2210JD6-5]MDY7394880.1 TlpA disulfide reductase family protein [Aureibaculum sp. 2210JD6-5]